MDATPLPAGCRNVRDASRRAGGNGRETGTGHGDFNPGNVLFGRSGVTGVVDWISARRGTTLSDWVAVGARSLWPGATHRNQLLNHYAAAAERSIAGVDYWDVVSGALPSSMAPTGCHVPKLDVRSTKS